MSEQDDVQTTVGVLDGLRASLADCAKTCGGLEYRLEQAEAALAERDTELHEALRVVYEEGWPGTENEHPWPNNDPEHLEPPEYERAMTPEEFLADLRACAEEGSGA